jgi:uncharacterized protein (DUF1697 family)
MKYVAFLRGINVGGRVVRMVDLKLCLEKGGFTDIKTLLQSGNVVFQSNQSDKNDVRQSLEDLVSKQFDYPAKILVYRHDELEPIVRAYPFDTADEDYQHYVVFMDRGKADQFIQEFGEVQNSVELMVKGEGVIYWMVKKGMTLKSERSKYFTKAAYKEFNTSRNIKTLQKLLALQPAN